MANINLAPGTKYLALVRKRRLHLLILSASLLVLLFLFWGGLFVVSNDLEAKNKSLADQIRKVDVDIATLGEAGQRVVLFQDRLEVVDLLLDQHISWDPLLNDLERLLPHPTVLTKLSADLATSSIIVEGYTTDIDAVAQTLASLTSSTERNTIFTQGSFGGITSEKVGEGDDTQSRVRFKANFSFDKNRFSNNS